MMNSTRIRTTLTSLFLLLVLALATVAPAAEINDADALGGLKEGKGIFLVDVDDPQKAAMYLEIVEGTYRSMAAQQVDPDFILLFIGPSVRFLTTEPAADLAGSSEALASIADSVEAIGKLGVKMEVCVIATDFFKVPGDKLLPGLKLIGNGFNSLIGYQNKGYGLVPIF